MYHMTPSHVTGREEERHEEAKTRRESSSTGPSASGFPASREEYGCTGGERREGKGAKAEARRLNAEESPSALVGHGEAVWNPAELIEAQQVGPGGEGNAGKHNCAVLFRNYSGVTPYPSQEKGERWEAPFG
ncbi:hypothetical protein CIHG_05988 [Coccidioides immitis H538.4]|uniref:Uncharacterized protein n=2 Tax=Coccidioides immitis TaxID=5501 RepID=A0A0J8RR26_COCIT|nr:hypothetical protein CIRG_01737 [Coccidioides immitis RMSCC 2394]KMU87595.1 hypothetical protein CIHG_05988 [Coccidioides immitis H538.4]